jgi:hypothetical protein
MARKARIILYIDQLTDSIKDARTGQSLSTDFCHATALDIVKTKQWLFDWHLELSSRREIYKLFFEKASQRIARTHILYGSGRSYLG